MRNDSSGGWIFVAIGAFGLLFMIYATLNLRGMQRREPEKRTRNSFGTYLTPAQSLRRVPFACLVFAAMIGVGLWQLHGW